MPPPTDHAGPELDALPSRIMNLPALHVERWDTCLARDAYRAGHRDARHAAAELATFALAAAPATSPPAPAGDAAGEDVKINGDFYAIVRPDGTVAGGGDGMCVFCTREGAEDELYGCGQFLRRLNCCDDLRVAHLRMVPVDAATEGRK